MTHNGPLSLAEQRIVALMVSAPGSVIGGLDTLELDGFTGFECESVYVVLPGASWMQPPGVTPTDMHGQS